MAIADIRRVVRAVDLPVNVLILPGGPTVVELAAAGVARISVGSALAFAALGTAATSARDLLERGEVTYDEAAGVGRALVRGSFTAFERDES